MGLGADARDIDLFAVSRNPLANTLRQAAFTLGNGPGLGLVTDRLCNASAMTQLPATIARSLSLDEYEVGKRLRMIQHHTAHLASAFLCSPFEKATVSAIDGIGDFVSTSVGIGCGSALRVQ